MTARLISGYTDAAEQADWKAKCEREARFKYDEARTLIAKIASECHGLEDLILDGIADEEDAEAMFAFYHDKFQQLKPLYAEVHRWKRIMKKELGIEP